MLQGIYRPSPELAQVRSNAKRLAIPECLSPKSPGWQFPSQNNRFYPFFEENSLGELSQTSFVPGGQRHHRLRRTPPPGTVAASMRKRGAAHFG